MYVQDTNKRFKNTNESKQIEKNPSKETFHINFKFEFILLVFNIINLFYRQNLSGDNRSRPVDNE